MRNRNIKDMLSVIFEFSEQEEDAILGFIPMTQELFDSCVTRCRILSPDADLTYQKLIRKYPEYWEKYTEERKNG